MPVDNTTDPLDPLPPMPAGQKKFLAILGAVLLALLAAGVWYLYAEGAFSDRPAYDKTWAWCERGDTCTAVRAPCDSWVAINDNRREEAASYYNHMMTLIEESPQMECNSPPQGDVQPKAYCMSGICTLGR